MRHRNVYNSTNCAGGYVYGRERAKKEKAVWYVERNITGTNGPVCAEFSLDPPDGFEDGAP